MHDERADRQTDLDLDLSLFRARVSKSHQLEAADTGVNEMQADRQTDLDLDLDLDVFS